jgi:imidazolonepropionase
VTSSPGFDHVWRNARIATLAAGHPGLGVVERGAIAVQDDRIAWIGEDADLPSSDAPVTDCQGRWITPGLIDCHTHLVYAGNRAREFEMRLEGASYEQIALAGGGIASSVRQLRTADENAVLDQTLPRLDALISEGVTTVEVKSGYGLDPDNERKSLRVACRLADERPVTVTTTFLGMHAMPPGESDRDAYIATALDQMLPALADEGLLDAVDAFCEGVAFTPEEVARLFEAARDRNLPVKLHADQLSDLGVRAMADAGTVAVLLPGAFYFLRETRQPPVELFRRYGVPMAIATDSNPGTSPLTSMLLAMNMAATLFGLTVEECLIGSTRVAARALGMHRDAGSLEAGKRADLAIWDIDEPAELVYRIGFNPLHARIWRGKP